MENIALKVRTPHWIKPELICEVKFSEWTNSGMIRHPAYKVLRDDKALEEIVPQETENPPISKSKSASSTLDIEGISVSVSNLEKVYWPEAGYTNYALFDYYLHIQNYIISYLKNRSQNLQRHPNVSKKHSFTQKANEITHDWLQNFKG